ncbi:MULTISPECIES: EAL domain-containing protein [unclassified Ensifer]|uniref:EAL domain-containing protein n=1 Tax=unclassified Ensifer TaxID=2633371 RepID=UPI000813224B|nr:MULTISPECIES: EAL domain-containing protein [unclassified Ensifer]OCP00501.1 histidine kinase [Ensifer sp. LC14]OCP05871.1 histidine kinase [Ensifer sp. LC11]OCP06620.1 histidine kinase [Ensifer sp. LC13]OCP31140.1 histidine kinase [Ensifer sp. LC499]
MYDRVLDVFDHAAKHGRVGFSLQHVNCVTDVGQVLYSECLGRLVKPDGEIMTASEFIGYLEATGRVAALDRHMLALAFDWLACHPSGDLGCNISAANISDERNRALLFDLLFANAWLAPRLVLELTESLPISAHPAAGKFLQALRDLGYRVAVDDFGTGFSTPEALLSLPVDIVKIDGFFLRLGRSEAKRFLLHMVGLATCVAPVVVVEGVETYEQFETARAAGASHVQGFLLSEPTLTPLFGGAPHAARNVMLC